jgi:hypothetical protein
MNQPVLAGLAAITLVLFSIESASAMPVPSPSALRSSDNDVIRVKGGHGHGGDMAGVIMAAEDIITDGAEDGAIITDGVEVAGITNRWGVSAFCSRRTLLGGEG